MRTKLILFSEAQVLSPSMFTQLLVGSYLTHHPWRDQLKAFRELYRERRDAMLGALATAMPAGVQWTRPRGGFYVWLTLPKKWDSKAMMPRALAHKVAYVPGVGFYANGMGQRELRLSYCFPEPDRIREGVRRLASTLSEEADLQEVFGTQPRERNADDARPLSGFDFMPGPETT